MNIHAIGWGILAYTIAMAITSFLWSSVVGNRGMLFRVWHRKITFALLIGLAVTLITW